MDAVVAQQWPSGRTLPAVYGWLALDRRGNWLIKGERIANQALRDFISRNYEADDAGRWYFQNGPQRVYVGSRVHAAGGSLRRRRAARPLRRPFAARTTYLDDEGSVLIAGDGAIALLR